ncbi:unnamed protein product [Urochloa humidicola]
MKFRVVCRKLYDYVRYDLKEIAFLSSLPDPPHIKKWPKLRWHDHWCILKEATRLYGTSWVRDIGPDLRPNDYNKASEDDEESSASLSSDHNKKGRTSSSKSSVLEDLAVAAKGGAETLKPALRQIYMTRAHSHQVPGTKGSRDGIEERGTPFLVDFYRAGTQAFPRSRSRNGVPGMRNAASSRVPGDYARASTYTTAMNNFMETYQEGLKDQLQEKADNGDGGLRRQQQGNEATKPPPQPSS